MPTKPARRGNSDWPLTSDGLANINDNFDDLYKKLGVLTLRVDGHDTDISDLAARVTTLEETLITAADVATIMLAAGKCATVATSETQSGATAYADLSTPGPSVSVTMTGTVAIVWVSCTATKGSAGNSAFIAPEVSGASSVAASDTNAAAISNYAASHNLNLSRVLVLTGLTPGTNDFEMKYSNDGGGIWTFFNRSIAVYAP